MADIEDLINNVLNQDFSAAGPTFNELMNDRVADALEQEKIAVAGQIFNGEEPEEEQLEFDLDDIDDEEIDDAIDEVDDDEEEIDEE